MRLAQYAFMCRGFRDTSFPAASIGLHHERGITEIRKESQFLEVSTLLMTKVRWVDSAAPAYTEYSAQSIGKGWEIAFRAEVNAALGFRGYTRGCARSTRLLPCVRRCRRGFRRRRDGFAKLECGLEGTVPGRSLVARNTVENDLCG